MTISIPLRFGTVQLLRREEEGFFKFRLTEGDIESSEARMFYPKPQEDGSATIDFSLVDESQPNKTVPPRLGLDRFHVERMPPSSSEVSSSNHPVRALFCLLKRSMGHTQPELGTEVARKLSACIDHLRRLITRRRPSIDAVSPAAPEPSPHIQDLLANSGRLQTLGSELKQLLV